MIINLYFMEPTLERHHNVDSATRSVDAERYYSDYLAHKKDLIATAAVARDEAVSYRGFKVGCALMAVAPESTEIEYGIHFGYNFKPVPAEQKGSTKRCAERNAIESALGDSTSLVVAMVTVSRQFSTGDPSKAHDVLHPCGDCREMLRDYRARGVLSGDSIICCVNDSADTTVEDEQTIDQLLEKYEYEMQMQEVA